MRKKALRALAHTGKSVALSGVFVAAALTGVVVNGNAPPTRRLVARVANDAIASLFQGRLAIGELRELSLGATGLVRVAQAEITDPEGRRVVLAQGIDARIDLKRLVRSALFGHTPEVFIDSARIDDAEVILDFDDQGELGVARAFLPRPSTKPKPTPTTATAVAEDVRLSIESAYVHHAWVHGNVVPPALDADAAEVHAHVYIFDNRLTVRADDAQVTMRKPRVPGQTGDVHGNAHGELGVPLKATRQDIVMHWDLEGDGSGIPLTAHLALKEDRLTMAVDVAPASPEVVKGAFPFLPLSRPLELHAKGEGAISQPLAITASGHVGDAGFVATGELGLGNDQPFRLDADLTQVDAASFSGPSSDVSGHVHAEGVIASGAPSGTFTVTTRPGTVSRQPAPAITAEGHFDTKRVQASFRASEPGVAADGEVTVHIPEKTLAFDVRARSRDLRALARAPNVLGGSGSAHATGTLDLASSTLDAHVTADGAGLSRAPASADAVHVEATVTGPVADPVIDVTASARQVRLTANAAPHRPGEKAPEPLTYPTASGHARIVLSPTPRITGGSVHVDSSEKGAAIDASATSIVLGGNGEVEVRGGKIAGLGADLETDLQVTRGGAIVKLRGQGVDMKRVAAMTGIRQLRLLPEGMLADLDVDLKTSGDRSDGHIDVAITGAKDGTSAEVHAKLAGKSMKGTGRVQVGAVGWIEVASASLELPSGLGVRSLERATGAADLRGQVDLSQGAALLGGEAIEKMSGIALLSARIERADPGELPTLYASASTRGLDVTLNREGVSTHIAGIELGASFGHDSATDDTELALVTWDAKGVLASADAKARVPLVGWLSGKKPFNREAVAALQVGGLIDVAPRDVSDLPGILARPDFRGKISARAQLSGSLARPRVRFVAQGDRITARRLEAGRGPRYAPIDSVLQGHWDGNDVVATLTIDEREREPRPPARSDAGPVAPAGTASEPRNVKTATPGHVRGLLLARVPVDDLVAGRAPAWDASAELDVADLELAPLPLPLNARGVLTGRVKLRDLTSQPVLDASAQIEGLTLGGARVALADVKVEARNGSVNGRARVNQDDGGSGRVSVTSNALDWRGLDVAWNDAKPTHIDYAVDRFRVSILRPFVRRYVPEVDGQIDGKGSATVDADKHVFEGGLSLTQGRLYVTAIGEEISDVGAVAHFERDGAFRVEDVTGKIGSGEIKASASGRMKGLHFQSAEAVLVVPSKEGVPLSAEGATFASATGEIHLSAALAPDKNAMLVTVTVPRTKITVPNRSTQTLQSLDPDETIAVGIRLPDGKLAATKARPGMAQGVRAAAATAAAGGAAPEEAAMTTRFTVVLGKDVELEGRGVRLGLDGRTIVEVAEEVSVTGQIALKSGGTIDVQGRKFIVDHGTVTFVKGDAPTDPIVIAAAYWDSPDRTRVWVEFNGPLKTGKLTLRSEPPYSKNEILSILLFGRADPNQAPSEDRPSDAQQATAVGTGIASSGLNKALGELDEDFDLEQDRTSANRVRTKLGYRLRRNLKVELGYASGFSQREPDTTYLFLEWQFIPQWSLIGTRGDRGTSILDVLFQHRY